MPWDPPDSLLAARNPPESILEHLIFKILLMVGVRHPSTPPTPTHTIFLPGNNHV